MMIKVRCCVAVPVLSSFFKHKAACCHWLQTESCKVCALMWRQGEKCHSTFKQGSLSALSNHLCPSLSTSFIEPAPAHKDLSHLSNKYSIRDSQHKRARELPLGSLTREILCMKHDKACKMPSATYVISLHFKLAKKFKVSLKWL